VGKKREKKKGEGSLFLTRLLELHTAAGSPSSLQKKGKREEGGGGEGGKTHLGGPDSFLLLSARYTHRIAIKKKEGKKVR